MKIKKIPLRTCVITKESLPKKELLRIVRTPEMEVKVDESGKLNGRGAYICRNEECLNKVIKTKRLERVLDKEISSEIYENIRGVIIGK